FRSAVCHLVFLFTTPRPPKSTLFPYTTLFRSELSHEDLKVGYCRRSHRSRISWLFLCYGSRPSAANLSVRDPSEINLSMLPGREDRKSTRLNSSHVAISYAVFCLKKKKKKIIKKLKTKILMIVYRKMR